MDKMLKASLDWINSIAFPNAGFDHPNDVNKVKCVARALDIMGIQIDNQEVIDYCRSLGMPQESIDKIVDWYGRPKRLRLKDAMTFSANDLKEIWSRKENQEKILLGSVSYNDYCDACSLLSPDNTHI